MLGTRAIRSMLVAASGRPLVVRLPMGELIARIERALREAPDGLTFTEICAACGRSKAQVCSPLWRLLRDRRVERVSRGVYRLGRAHA